MTKKKLLLFGLCLTMLFGIVGCSIKSKDSNSEKKIASDDLKAIKSGIDSLSKFSDAYIVSNVLSAPDGTISYLVTNTSDGSYTEYPVDENGNIGGADTSKDTVSYTLTDWLTSDNKYYVVNNTATETSGIEQNTNTSNGFAYLPDDYGKKLASRKVLYLDTMVDNFTAITNKGSSKIDLGDGDELITLYECDLPSKDFQNVLGMNSAEMYKSIKENTKDKKIKKFCNFYLDDASRNLVCSDAVVTVGVDSKGMVRYMGAEVGGLGTHLYYSMTVITKVEDEIRTKPTEIDSAVNYIDTIKDYAYYIAGFNSYNDALEAMYKSSNTNEETPVENTDEETPVENTDEETPVENTDEETPVEEGVESDE